MSPISRLLLPLLAATLASAAPARADEDPGPLRAAGVTGPFGHEKLSDERTVTRVGWPRIAFKIRSGPGRSFATTGALRFYTEDRAPENYLVLRSRLDDRDRPWLQIRVPRRPNGSKGWVPASSLRLKTLTTQLEVDKGALRARLRDAGKVVWRSRIGVGKASTPTPNGRYWIRERLANLGGDPVYGPYAFGTAAYSRLSDWPGGGVIGVHGTNAPGLLPGRVSNGCVRVPNDKLLRLKALMPVGTPVHIHD